MAKSESPRPEDMALTRVLSALSDPLRLGLVQLLSDGTERQWGELDAPVSKSTLSHHLKVLRSAGITETREEGTRCYVKLRSSDVDQRFPGLLRDVLDAITDETTPVRVKAPSGA
jgi:DNA-binding transcriptional ArsR family regulator